MSPIPTNAVLASKLDSLKSLMTDEFSEMKAKQDKTNGRVTNLEQWRWIVTGFIVCLSVIVLPVAMKVLDLTIKR